MRGMLQPSEMHTRLKENPMLTSERLQLRPVCDDDLEQVLAWLHDPDVNVTLAMRAPVSMSEERKWLASLDGSKTDKVFTIFRTGDDDGTGDEAIGGIGLHAIDAFNGSCTCGLYVGRKDLWGRGYATEALQLVLAFAFGNLRLHRVELEVFSTNDAAIRVYEKVGFVREGVRRDALYKNGVYVDHVVMSVLEPEWRARQPS